MFTNNIDAINAAFYLLDKKEAKINYYYEPRFSKKEKDWKRCYIINELKTDFIKDVNNFGFSPFKFLSIDCLAGIVFQLASFHSASRKTYSITLAFGMRKALPIFSPWMYPSLIRS